MGLQRSAPARWEIGQLAMARAFLALAGVSVAAVMRDLQVRSSSWQEYVNHVSDLQAWTK
jgi:cob(I)alamin adenosyltransferase